MANSSRDIYYKDVAMFKAQRNVDETASSKGLFAGEITLIMKNGTTIDGNSNGSRGVLIPEVAGIERVETNAEFVLAIEKEASFGALLEVGIAAGVSGRCIVITGKGYPDVITRRFLKLLSNIQRPILPGAMLLGNSNQNATPRLSDNGFIPIFGLFDCDPHGVEIFLCYKYGSKAMAFDSINLAIRTMRWLGLKPSDKLDEDKILNMTDDDRVKARQILMRPVIRNNTYFK
ncbi:endodeoxyribonuclease [Blyttiomyces sp. JEL0837]|nr:endodeoxyribonuclease [Blyttiomyces sp. JEL0837]